VSSLAVVGVGAVTPLGLHAVDTAFANRASAAGMRQAPLVDAEGEPITMCFLPTLDPLLTGAERAASLAGRALEEALQSVEPLTSMPSRARMVVAIDEFLTSKTPGERPPAEHLARLLTARARSLVPSMSVEVTPRGPAGPSHALPALRDELTSGALDFAILGGVHTDYDPARIAEIDGAGRLFRPDNLDALIPGEAAAFVVLMRADVARRLKIRERASILASATAFEKARPDNDESAFQAVGLTSALRTVLSEPDLRVGWVLTDLTFETFRHFELQAALTRTQRWFCEPHHVESPAQRMGYLGAAATPLHLVLASEAFRRGFAPHRFSVSIVGSDSGERGVLLVSRPS
jgi:3-oxoacyl-[acyl-carrier-protein] synthase-1